MNKRELWLTIGLITVLASLPAMGLWQQARYRRAERATQAFIEAQQRAETGEAVTAAMFRQAQPQLRQNLLAGDFDAALQRLTALQDEDALPAADKAHGKAVPLRELWPPHSPARAAAQAVLQLMVRKQAQGFDVAGAQEALLQVAKAARQGDKKQALAAFSTVAALVRTAPVRAGFQTASSKVTAATGSFPPSPSSPTSDTNPQRLAQLRASVSGLAAAGGKGALPPVSVEQMQQLEQSIQTFQLILPQLMERAAPAQRPLLQRLPPFLNALLAAYHAGKDIRPVMPYLQQIMAVGKRNPSAASGLLDTAWIALNTAKPLPSGAVLKGAAPPARFKHPPLPLHLPLPPAGVAKPVISAARPSSAMPAPPPTQRILQMLDVIRKLPEPVYQQQRPQIARFIDGTMAGMAGRKNTATVPPSPHAPRPLHVPAPPMPRATPHLSSRVPETSAPTLKTTGSSVGNAAKLRLDFDAGGQIIGLWGLGHDLAPGITPGGVALQRGDAPVSALRGAIKGDSAAITANLGSNGSARYEAAGRDISIHLKTAGKVAGSPATLLLRIPLQAAGWHWDTGSDAQIIAVDGTYNVTADESGKLPMITLRGSAIRLAVLAPDASSIAYNAATGALEVRFAVNGASGGAEHVVSLTISH